MRLTRFADLLSEIASHAGAIIVIPLIAALVYEVFARYAFDAPTLWAYEISYMLTGSIFMLGMGYALKHKQHVNVDFIHGILSTRSQAILDLVGYLLLIPALFWLSIELAQYAYQAFENGEVSGKSAWNPIVWPFRLIWVIGFSVLALQMLAEAARAFCFVLNIKTEGDDR